jgi:hypothetical protein
MFPESVDFAHSDSRVNRSSVCLVAYDIQGRNPPSRSRSPCHLVADPLVIFVTRKAACPLLDVSYINPIPEASGAHLNFWNLPI